MEILCLILGKSFTVSLIDAIVCKNEASHEEAAVVIYVMALYDERTQSINTGCLFFNWDPPKCFMRQSEHKCCHLFGGPS